MTYNMRRPCNADSLVGSLSADVAEVGRKLVVKLVQCQRKESKTIWLGAGYSGSAP